MPFLPLAIPRAVVHPPEGPAWLFEPKLDGWRVQVAITSTGVRLYTRHGNIISHKLPRLRSALGALPAGTVLDAELVATEGDFWSIARALGSDRAMVAAFDVLMLSGGDVRPLPLIERKALLGALVSGIEGIVEVPTFDDGARLLAAVEEHGGEGVVSKCRDAPYRAGPTRTWLKSKTLTWREANRERWRAFIK